MRESNLSDFLS